MIFRIIPLLLLVLLVTLGAVTLANQDAPGAEVANTVEATEAVDTPQRGIAVQFQSGSATDTRIDRLIALHVPAGQQPTPLVPAGAFTATYTGHINIGLRGRYTFSLQGRGKVKVMLADKIILEGEGDLSAIEPAERVRLNKGENAVTVEYTSPAQGDATLRLYWQSDEFPREMIPPGALTHTITSNSESLQVREGRELFATLRCVKCHEADDDLKQAGGKMAELDLDAPSLATAGTRLKPSWMAAWIHNPLSLRPDATMPRVHVMTGAGPGGQSGQGDAGGRGTAGGQGNMPSMWAADIAAYLATVGEPSPPLPAAKPESVKAGGHLFASLGCIGCHTLPDHQDVKSVDGRVPLKHVNAKWQPAALRAFLLKPTSHYAWIRMPDFALSDGEADELTAFLTSFPVAAVPSREGRGRAPSIDHGRQMFQMHGCVACHDHGAKEQGWINHLKAPTLAELKKGDWTKGCLTDDVAKFGRAPDFALNIKQRQALRAFASSMPGWRSLTTDTAHEFATRQIAQLQCIACHKRDGENDRWSNHEAEVATLLIKPAAAEKPKIDDFDDEVPGGEQKEVQIDQSRPELTWVGEKLKPQWMETFFAGKLDYKLRPWLTARMPAFPARAKGLSQGLALQHGLPLVAPPEPKPDVELSALGKQLIGRSIEGKAGFACVQCHGIGDKPAENVFEAQGINFAYSQERLRHEYYMRWMLKPARVQPGTRMPQFAADDGTTPFVDVLGGDGRKQFDAIWEYLLEGREMKAP